MEFNPSSTTIGVALSEKEDFFIPRYQRSYAWEDSQTDDFYKDMTSLYNARCSEISHKHFFGAVLVIQREVVGSRRRRWEVVDGQQRLTTFSLLGLRFLAKLSEIRTRAMTENAALLTSIDELHSRANVKWHKFNDLVNRRTQEIRKLTLSRADDTYYRDLVQGRTELPTGAQSHSSHTRLKASYEAAERFINNNIKGETVDEEFDKISILDEVLDEDCQIMWVDCKTRDDAYRLFQVLNDRGAGLSDGDLLRNSTLETISHHGDATLDEAGDLWDRILRDEYSDQASHLRWYYTARIGSAPDSTNVHGDYLKNLFHIGEGERVDHARKEALMDSLRKLDKGVDRLRNLKRGEWPYEPGRANQWKRARLGNLISRLEHDRALPLLLSLSENVDEDTFSRACHILELFFFRYKIICGGHVSRFSKIYYQTARDLSNGSNFNEQTFRASLQSLLDSDAGEDIFSAQLRDLSYERNYENRFRLRYTLVTIEEYFDSYSRGDTPLRIRDDSRVLDPGAVTIEHIYPNRAKEADRDPQLEEKKGNLGNLTILARIPNREGANNPFSEKKLDYSNDSAHLTRSVGSLTAFTINELRNREDELIRIANRAFRLV